MAAAAEAVLGVVLAGREARAAAGREQELQAPTGLVAVVADQAITPAQAAREVAE